MASRLVLPRATRLALQMLTNLVALAKCSSRGRQRRRRSTGVGRCVAVIAARSIYVGIAGAGTPAARLSLTSCIEQTTKMGSHEHGQ